MRIWLDLSTATKVLIAFASMLFLTCVCEHAFSDLRPGSGRTSRERTDQ